MTFQESLSRLGRKCRYEAVVGVRQIHRQVMGLLRQSPQALRRSHRFPRRMRQRPISNICFGTLRNMADRSVLDKQRLQRRIFPSGAVMEKTGIGTPVIHSIYTLLGDDPIEESVLVAPQGFEPRLIGSEPTVLPLNEGAMQGWRRCEPQSLADCRCLLECTRCAG